MAPLDEIRAAFLRKPWKRVVNASGEAIPPFAVLRVISSSNAHGEILVSVGKPNTTFLSEYLVNGPWAIAVGGEGLATDLSEANYVLYGTGSPAVGEEWGPEPSQWYLKKYRYGFRIKGGTYFVGALTAIVAQQVGMRQIICKSNEEIAADGDTGAISVYDGNQVDTTLDISGCVNRTGIIFADDTWGTATYMGSTMFLEPWEC